MLEALLSFATSARASLDYPLHQEGACPLERQCELLVSLHRLLYCSEGALEIASRSAHEPPHTRTGGDAPGMVDLHAMLLEEVADLLRALEVAERHRRLGGVRVHAVHAGLSARHPLGRLQP